MHSYSRATSLFLDRFQLSPGPADLQRLELLASAFGALPWENLTKLLAKHRERGAATTRLPPSLRSVPGAERLRLGDEVLADHVASGTGGTCFSLTNALRRIVTDLDFRAWPAMADMHHGPNVHCALVVEIDGGRYLLDPGYLVDAPVPLLPAGTSELRTRDQLLRYRVEPGGESVELLTSNARGEQRRRYRLRLRPVPEAEFVRHWLASFEAGGMNGLHLNRRTVEGRLSAHDLNLRIDDGRVNRNVKLRDGYDRQVSDRFGIDLELVRRAYELWERQRCRAR